MKSIKLSFSCFIFCFLTIIIQSCEGIKPLTVRNNTDKDVYIQTKPAIPSYRDNATENKPQIRAANKTYLIMPDSALVIPSNFTSLLFNRKFREEELTIDYLLIATPTDTIIAKSRKEIIHLIENSPNQQSKSTDHNYAVGNKKNVIIINARQ